MLYKVSSDLRVDTTSSLPYTVSFSIEFFDSDFQQLFQHYLARNSLLKIVITERFWYPLFKKSRGRYSVYISSESPPIYDPYGYIDTILLNGSLEFESSDIDFAKEVQYKGKVILEDFINDYVVPIYQEAKEVKSKERILQFENRTTSGKTVNG